MEAWVRMRVECWGFFGAAKRATIRNVHYYSVNRDFAG
jgi:hypothetical protein